MFSYFDKDRSGQISFDEFLVALRVGNMFYSDLYSSPSLLVFIMIIIIIIIIIIMMMMMMMMIIIITIMIIIINNIIIANEQGGSQIEQWAEKISNRCNI